MRILKEIGKASFVGLLIFIIVGLILYFTGAPARTGKELLLEFIYNQIFSIGIYMANYVLIRYLMKRNGNEFFKFKNISKAMLG
ncbi:MAG: histidine kinase, partial [Bacteroidota bacterium]